VRAGMGSPHLSFGRRAVEFHPRAPPRTGRGGSCTWLDRWATSGAQQWLQRWPRMPGANSPYECSPDWSSAPLTGTSSSTSSPLCPGRPSAGGRRPNRPRHATNAWMPWRRGWTVSNGGDGHSLGCAPTCCVGWKRGGRIGRRSSRTCDDCSMSTRRVNSPGRTPDPGEPPPGVTAGPSPSASRSRRRRSGRRRRRR